MRSETSPQRKTLFTDKLLLSTDIFEAAQAVGAGDAVVARYCCRQIDRQLKKIDLSKAKSIADIQANYTRLTAAIDITAVANGISTRIQAAIAAKDLPKLLANFDNKGLLALAAKHLRKTKRNDFEEWLTRLLRNNKVPELQRVLRANLPAVDAK